MCPLSLENDVCVMCYFSYCTGKDETVTVLFKTIVNERKIHEQGNVSPHEIVGSYTFFGLMCLLSLENDVCVMCYFSHCNGKDEAVAVLFKTIVRLKLM